MSKKIAVINDLSGFGRCSLSVAMPIITVQGIECCALPTGIFSNQTGYDSFKSVDLTDYMPGFINEWKKLSPKFDGILSGFITSSAQGKIIEGFIDDFKGNDTIVVVDPVMGDDGKVYPCYDDESINSIKRLVQKADIITPNLTELCLLCDEDFDDVDFDLIEEMSKSFGDKSVITTGIKIDKKTIANAVYSKGNFDIVKCDKSGDSFSGTGDIMSSFVISKCVNGESPLKAVQDATAFIEAAISDTVKKPYNPADGVNFEKFLKNI